MLSPIFHTRTGVSGSKLGTDDGALEPKRFSILYNNLWKSVENKKAYGISAKTIISTNEWQKLRYNFKSLDRQKGLKIFTRSLFKHYIQTQMIFE